MKTREIFVPYNDLKVILDAGPHRVLLSREEYDDLVKKAKKMPEEHIPHPAVAVSSDYNITVEDGRARIRGTVLIDALDDGLHAVPLDLGDVGLLSATLDDKPAMIGRAADVGVPASAGYRPPEGGTPAPGGLNLLVSGKGRHRLDLDMVAPLEMTSAQQELRFRLANASVGKWHLTVPGDVEIKSGADVVSRELDKTANVTRFELLPRGGDTRLSMSLNSHLQRREQAVAARSIVFDEVTEAYERLHATITYWVLHRAVDHFSFFVPEGFEITQIDSPLLARWDIATEAGRKVVNVRLREQTTDTVALSVSAIKTSGSKGESPIFAAPPPASGYPGDPAKIGTVPQLKSWHFPRLELRDVVSQVTVLGLVVQSDLKTESLTGENLIAIDAAALSGALPASFARQEADASPRTFVAAYYAPQTGYELKANFTRPAATLAVTTHLMLKFQDQGCEVEGGFMLTPTTEKLFSVDFTVAAGWNVTAVTGPGNVPLVIERFGGGPHPNLLPKGEGTAPGRIHVKLPQGIPPGQAYPVDFRATYTPKGWMSDWDRQSLEFPMFGVVAAASDEGALAVADCDEKDMIVRPEKLERLVPIVDAEKARFGLANSPTALAYRYEARGAKAALVVDRKKPRITARTLSFFKIDDEGIAAHYEVIYKIEAAKTRRLSLLLPASTPDNLKIYGVGGVSVKEYVSEPADARSTGFSRDGNEKPPEGGTTNAAGGLRRWKILLGEARGDRVQLAADFHLPWDALIQPQKPDATGKTLVDTDYVLPLVQAGDVLYQTGVVAVEGGAELDVQVKADDHARRADVGLLAPAEYKTGPRLLAVYSYLGDKPNEPKITIDVFRNPSYALTPAIIESAAFKTLLSADGNSQMQANFQIRTKASFLEVQLPKNATLWSALLDGTPLKPQKKDDIRLLGLPAAATNAARSLQLVYEVGNVLSGGRMRLAAPRLLYRTGDAKQSTEIPLVNVRWNVSVPAGYEVISTEGTLEPQGVRRLTPAPLRVADALYTLGGGGLAEQMQLISNLSGGEAAARKSAMKQWGMAYSQRVTSQDNLVSESPSTVVNAIQPAAPQSAEAPAETALSPPTAAAPAAPPPTTRFGLAGSLSDAEFTVAEAKPAPAASPYPTVPAPAIAKPAATEPAKQPTTDGELRSADRGDSKSGPQAGRQSYRDGKLLGVNSLKIDIQQSEAVGAQTHRETPAEEQVLTFTSLGADPKVVLTLADANRVSALSYAAGLIAFLIGVMITGRSVRLKFAFVVVLAIASALVPLVWDTVDVAVICNAVFYAACLLVPYYLAAGAVCWMLTKMTNISNRWLGRAATAAAIMVAFSVGFSMPTALRPQAVAQEGAPSATPAPDPVTVPDDALIVPYDAKLDDGVAKADRLLVPYAKYVELWNRAHPDKKLEAHPAPLSYTLSGAAYSATLEGEDTLNVVGQMQINVLAEDYVSIPLALRGGVLAKAVLDGKPAQMRIVGTPPVASGQGVATPTVAQNALTPSPSPGGRGELGPGPSPGVGAENSLFLLQVTGKGEHKLELEVRLKLDRKGGWRGTAGALPSAPAATITFRVPQPQTEVRLGQTVDRRNRETTQADEKIETALGPGGTLQVQWRPKVAEAQVDRGLTVDADELLDVEEDGLRMAVNLKLEFRRGQRDGFTLSVPGEYLVEKVAGGNVRGWEVRRGDKEQTIEVSLLKTAKDSEQISLFLARSGRVGAPPRPASGYPAFDVPYVTVRDAALTSGQVTIRRSVLLDVRTVQRSGVTRVDLGPLPDGAPAQRVGGGPATEESVLAIRPYEAYRFPTTPFSLRLTAAPVEADVTAETQTSVKLSTDQPGLESRIMFHIGQRKIYRLEVAVPDDLRLPDISLPAAGQWTIEKQGDRRVLRVNLLQGIQGEATLIVRGKLDGARSTGFSRNESAKPPEGGTTNKQPPEGATTNMPLPRLDVLGVARQEGDIAVQADPAFNVDVHDLHDCQEIERERVNAWLDAPLRDATRVALHYTGGAASARLTLVARKPEIVCDTITNVKVTDRDIEETIMLNYEIRNAGVRELTFLLPGSMRDAQISTPMLRRGTVEPVDAKMVDGPVRVRLELQGDAMNDQRVLIMNDRLLPSGSDSYAAPLPVLETADGRTADFLRRQFVVLESTNRDEPIFEPLQGLEAVNRQQQEWKSLCGLLGTDNLSKAFFVQPGAVAPRLSFHLQRQEDLETAGARIDLAETTLVLDSNGAYRAKVEFTLLNSSEQFLDVELPGGAELWTVNTVRMEPSGPLSEPLKPVRVPVAGVPAQQVGDRHVLVPVVKTAKGDLSYRLVLKYGGKLSPLSAFSTVRFPLVRNVRSYPGGTAIGIERSQLAIYVPRSHEWFDFGRKMHLVDESQQKAARIAASNLEGQRLMEQANDADPFTRARVNSSLQNWARQAVIVQEEAHEDLRRDSKNDRALQTELLGNNALIAKANTLVQSNSLVNPRQEATVDNRERLNDLYKKQVNVNATDTLSLLGNNSYSGATTVTAGATTQNVIAANNAPGYNFNDTSNRSRSGSEFNAKWIDRNNLKGGNANGGAAALDINGNLATVNDMVSNERAAQRVVLGNNNNAFFNYDNPSSQSAQAEGLTKAGTGQMALSGVNTYNGGTIVVGGGITVSGGTLQLANPNGDTGGVGIGGPGQLSGPISGNGALVLGGANGSGNVSVPQYRPGQTRSSSAEQGSQQSGQGKQGDEQQRELAQYQQKLSPGNNAGFGSLNGIGFTSATIPSGNVAQQQPGGQRSYGPVATADRPGELVGEGKNPHDARGADLGRKADGQPPTVAAQQYPGETTNLPAAPGGLASLDFELPTDPTLYTVYRFATPRGEAELTARNISTSVLSRLISLAAIAAACVVLWAAVILVRRGALGWFRHPLGAALLLVGGIVLLCNGVLPVVGLMAAIAGFGLLIASLVARLRRDAAATA